MQTCMCTCVFEMVEKIYCYTLYFVHDISVPRKVNKALSSYNCSHTESGRVAVMC